LPSRSALTAERIEIVTDAENASRRRQALRLPSASTPQAAHRTAAFAIPVSRQTRGS
jgi:hypothetical protein